ncbi:MAG TPA: NTP transferase domain-containing protein, partial [Chloroflexota bacterium]
MGELLAIVLAAGQGTRMRSALPKVLHRIAGRAMVDYVVDAARQAGASRVIVVVGHGIDQMREHFQGRDVEL